jgi:hypothetical protein
MHSGRFVEWGARGGPAKLARLVADSRLTAYPMF